MKFFSFLLAASSLCAPQFGSRSSSRRQRQQPASNQLNPDATETPPQIASPSSSDVATGTYLPASMNLTNQDYVNLKTSITRFILSTGDGPDRNIALLVRLSFHDIGLFNGKTLGPQGCLAAESIQAIPDNAGLPQVIQSLSAWIQKELPSAHYPMGDVFSLAGKVATELAYPCMKIAWGFGRSVCPNNLPLASDNRLPDGKAVETAQVDPILDNYGLNPTEMTVLLAGAHGLAKAQTHIASSGFSDAPLSHGINSGMDWLERTFNQIWTIRKSAKGQDEFQDQKGILRMPIDLLWFPTVAKASGGVADRKSDPIEDNMRQFLTGNRNDFDMAYQSVYTKMLQIGVPAGSLVAFQDSNTPASVCVDRPTMPPMPPAP